MNAKLSKWLAVSTKFLQARIGALKENSEQFVEELNLRREAVSETIELNSELSNNNVEGVYQIIGANSENAEHGYFGVLTLKYDENRIFAIWLIEGEETQTGFGLLTNNVLSINFVYERDAVEYTGLVSYEFLSDSMISGTWVEEGSDLIGVEFGRKVPVEIVDPLRYFGFN